MKKRVLSLLLVLIMVLGMLPMSAMAAETEANAGCDIATGDTDSQGGQRMRVRNINISGVEVRKHQKIGAGSDLRSCGEHLDSICASNMISRLLARCAGDYGPCFEDALRDQSPDQGFSHFSGTDKTDGFSLHAGQSVAGYKYA